MTTLCLEWELVISFVNVANSRPLSPISPTTITSASALRVIIFNKTDLPTPEPAIIPILWPRPIEVRALMLLIPTSKICFISPRSNGLTLVPLIGMKCVVSIGPSPSKGAPNPSITRPKSFGPTLTSFTLLEENILSPLNISDDLSY